MAKTPYEANTERETTTNITGKVDEALGYNYQQVREDILELIQRVTGLIQCVEKIPGSRADARLGSLTVTNARLIEIDYQLRYGDELAHQDAPPQPNPSTSP